MSPPGRSSWTSPGGRCRCSTRASARSIWRSASGPACSTSRTWARSRRAGPQAGELLQRLLSQRRREARRRRRAVQRPLPRGRRRAGRPLHLPPGARPLPDGHQRLQPREGPRVVPAPRRGPRRRRRGQARRVGDARRAGPGRPGARPGDRRLAAARALRRRHAHRRRPHDARLRHRLHRRGRASRSCCAPEAARRRLGRASSRRGAVPAGLAARDTLRLEVCYHLYGNDLMESRGPIEAGLGWCCKEDTGFIGADAVAAARAAGPAEKLVAFTLTGPGIARQGNPDRRRAARSRAGRSRRAWASASAWRTSPPVARPPARRSRSTSGARSARPSSPSGRCTAGAPRRIAPTARIQGDTMADASYPQDLLYHPEHDWVRIDDGDETSPCSASPGTPRTPSARSSSSTRPRSARPSARASPTPRSSR